MIKSKHLDCVCMFDRLSKRVLSVQVSVSVCDAVEFNSGGVSSGHLRSMLFAVQPCILCFLAFLLRLHGDFEQLIFYYDSNLSDGDKFLDLLLVY